MIAFLKGKIEEKNASCVYLDVNGVGYQVLMPLSSLAKLPEKGQSAFVYTYLQVSDAGVALYGFSSLADKELFEKLISVSGIGPKIALAALSAFDAADLVGAICAQDVAAVSQIPGVGKKTAQRIILELQGTLVVPEDTPSAGASAAVPLSAVPQSSLDKVKEDLLFMGFVTAEIGLALQGAPEDANEQALLSYALKRLGSQ